MKKMPDVFEIDPRLTKDSVIIVFHDTTVLESDCPVVLGETLFITTNN